MVSISGNGYRWYFSHNRTTEADAENLRELLAQEIERQEKLSRENREWIQRRLDRAQRSAAGLRGYIKRIKEGHA